MNIFSKKKFRALKQKLFFFMPRKKNSDHQKFYAHHVEETFRQYFSNIQVVEDPCLAFETSSETGLSPGRQYDIFVKIEELIHPKVSVS